jgi:hypothetical protein
MTSESSEPDWKELAWHREMERAFWEDEGEFLPGLAALMDRAAVFDDEPTHEKWRRGAKWK